MSQADVTAELARMRAFPLDPDEIKPDRWYQGREFWKTRFKRGPVNVSKSPWYAGVKEGKYPQGRKIGHEVFYYGAQILAIREHKDWRKIKVPREAIL